MSGIPNHRFSVQKGRQISSFEAGVDSIKRRFSNPFTGPRRTRDGEEAKISALSASRRSLGPPFRMPKSKGGHTDVDDDELQSGREESRRSGRAGKSKSNAPRIINGNSDYNLPNRTKNNDSGNRQDEASSDLQSPLNLDPFIEAARETLQRLLGANEAIISLSKSYTDHIHDIEEIPRIKQKFIEMEIEGKAKDETINMYKHTVRGLKRESEDMENDFARRGEKLEKERKKLKLERDEFDKTKDIAEKNLKVKEEKQRNKQDEEYGKIKQEHEKEYKILKQQLEQDIKKQADENRKRLDDLEAENHRLSEQLDKETNKCKKLETQLEKTQEDLDDQKMLKDAVKKEKLELDDRLKSMENEFALNSHNIEFYQNGFLEISESVEAISTRYFTELPDQEIETIQKKLIDADSSIASIPISVSEVSQKLRIAYTQRVISASLYNFIWQPFSSEVTIKCQDLVPLLGEIFAEITKLSLAGSTSGRAANVWRALTMYALESLSVDPSSTSSTSSKPTSYQGEVPSSPQRADKAISEIISTLSPLMNASQDATLRKDLRGLVNSAISIWNIAQADELNVTVCCTLNDEHRDEWRSQMFDPLPSPISPTDAEGSDTAVERADIKSKTRPRIFTLFPRVLAQQTMLRAPAEANGNKPRLPGGWYDDTEHERVLQQQMEKKPKAETTTYTIHPGAGLPEWSPLVLKGKMEEEEIKRDIEEAMRSVEARRRRNGGTSRRDSAVGLETGVPLSPTEKWRSGGAMKAVEE